MSHRNALRFAIACFTTFFLCGAANAQVFRAYLASTGSDANPCSLVAPCRLLPAAHAAVAGGGEIWMLDSANYNTGTVTLSKSVTILAVPGVLGSVVVTGGGPGILISTSGIRVTLRNLNINPIAGGVAGTHGVQMTSLSSLTIERSTIANVPNAGVRATAGAVIVTDSTIQGVGEYAVYVSSGANATVSSSRLLNNTTGGVVAATTAGASSYVDVSDTLIRGGSYGAAATATGSPATSVVTVTRSTISGTSNGVGASASAGGAAEVSIGTSMIANTVSAWEQTGTGVVTSLSNNQFRNNGAGFGTKSTFLPE